MWSEIWKAVRGLKYSSFRFLFLVIFLGIFQQISFSFELNRFAFDFSSRNLLASESFNPWLMAIDERILNRKQISHLVLENRPNEYRLTILVSDRFPYSYKAQSYPFFIQVNSETELLQLSKVWDQYLETGGEVYIRLKGSQIVGYRFLQKNEE